VIRAKNLKCVRTDAEQRARPALDRITNFDDALARFTERSGVDLAPVSRHNRINFSRRGWDDGGGEGGGEFNVSLC
jgi:hypothetical protein